MPLDLVGALAQPCPLGLYAIRPPYIAYRLKICVSPVKNNCSLVPSARDLSPESL